MKLIIPRVGDQLQLLDDWTFFLYDERRNSRIVHSTGLRHTPAYESAFETYIKDLNKSRGRYKYSDSDIERMRRDSKVTDYPIFLYRAPVTMPVNSILRIDRLYLRRPASRFDSVSFIVVDSSDPRFVGKSKGGLVQGTPRFWAKLADVNNIECLYEPKHYDWDDEKEQHSALEVMA